MSLGPADAAALKRAIKGLKPAQARRLFKAIRTNSDKALLAAATPAKRRAAKAKRRTDPLLREIDQTLKPILGPASEKADMLVEHLAKKHRRKLAFEPKGLADAVRKLRGVLSDEQIRTGAQTLVAQLNELYSDRETVV